MSAADYAWMASALCAQADPDLWTERGPGTTPKQICRRCPVRTQCGEPAAALEDTVGAVAGIWGGASRKQRKTTRQMGEAA
ncbi:WhiB family transcriptional regulator [Streptomyces sp. NPDC052773]|uniref:WhiB family transcriptional regulator n=1 Tax=Streptomyces sp. NPDC052773 TaxID=3365693 RepID=UPI0037D50824